MKYIYLTVLSTFSFVYSSHAQWALNGNNISNSNTGNVGIGTANPAWGKLNLTLNNGQQSSTQNNSLLAIEDNTYTTNGIINTRINWINANAVRIASIYAVHNAYGNNNADLAFDTGNGVQSIERMRIAANGNVGIGTSDTKGYKLAVSGNIIGESVTIKLQNTWPDYVFQSNYKTISLLDLENYIKINKHLPEIPTAKEVNEKGISLGAINAKLLKKTEELTLYMIELKKENEEFRKSSKRIDELEVKLNSVLSK